jgi:hypothetical protein
MSGHWVRSVLCGPPKEWPRQVTGNNRSSGGCSMAGIHLRKRQEGAASWKQGIWSKFCRAIATHEILMRGWWWHRLAVHSSSTPGSLAFRIAATAGKHRVPSVGFAGHICLVHFGTANELPPHKQTMVCNVRRTIRKIGRQELLHRCRDPTIRHQITSRS